ncbi:hypothetical protein D9613_001247 [Agrocybe pediades]|uniref:CFEM domain-containing protein n=1 Tax=Agrocybe pediades TaxID=84607 RepID=A0A8H4R2C0_9AGAR|nr:hypothetical protein D9613_001247 [Agrocybe pediades]
MLFNTRILFAGAFIVSMSGAAFVAAASINDMPPCGTPCAQTAANAVGCNLSDATPDRQCLCSHQSWVDATNQCARSSCEREDIGPVSGALSDFCSDVNISISTSATPTLSSSSSSASASSSGVSASVTRSSSSSGSIRPSSTTSSGTTTPATHIFTSSTSPASTTKEAAAAAGSGTSTTSGAPSLSLSSTSISGTLVIVTATLPDDSGATGLPSAAVSARMMKGVMGTGIMSALVLVLVQAL